MTYIHHVHYIAQVKIIMKIQKKNSIILLLSSIVYASISYGMEPREPQKLQEHLFPDYFLNMANPGLQQAHLTVRHHQNAIAYARENLFEQPFAALETATFLKE